MSIHLALSAFTASLLAASSTIVTSSRASAAPQSRYTSLANADCAIDAPDAEDEDSQSKTCPGLGGARVLVEAVHTRVRIGFVWPGGRKPKTVAAVAVAWSAGEKMEWRWESGTRGLAPYAATVRMLWNDDGDAQAKHQVLAVMKVALGTACLMGVVDIAATRDGYEQARKLADSARAFSCEADKPRTLGVATEWTRRTLEASAAP